MKYQKKNLEICPSKQLCPFHLNITKDSWNMDEEKKKRAWLKIHLRSFHDGLGRLRQNLIF